MKRRAAIRLPIHANLHAIQKETRRLRRFFSEYPNPVNKRKSFVLPLVSPAGDSAILDHYPGPQSFRATPWLRQCPNLNAALRSIPGPKFSVRLTNIPSGGGLHPHRDNWRNFRYGILRLHVPIITNKKAWVRIQGVKYHWAAGECWYGDFSQEHEVGNDGSEDRIHLVVDVGVTNELLNLFPAAFIIAKKKSGINYCSPPLSLDRDFRPEFYHCKFLCPSGFFPFKNQPKESFPVELKPTKKGMLKVHSPSLPTLTLMRVGTHKWQVRDAGPGNFLRFLPGKDEQILRIRLCLKGALYQHPVSKKVLLRDFEKTVSALRFRKQESKTNLAK